MRLFTLFLSALLLACAPALVLPSCTQKGANLIPPPFQEERAWADLEKLLSFGPRIIGSPASEQARAWIRAELEPLGWVFEEDHFSATPPPGAVRRSAVSGTNLIARMAGTLPQEIWICSHYDTLDRPRFVGANDSGSSSAVLMEIGRQLAHTSAQPSSTRVLCWFDGEEPFYPVPWDDQNNSTFGSRHLAERLHEEGALQRISALILLDMVGDRSLGVSIESMSSGWIRTILERTSRQLNDPQLFVDRREIKDDHLAFLRRGVPAADLIDFRFGPLNSWWHTPEDTLEKCSAQSMGRVGRVVLAALPALEKAAAARGR